jgi:hypothetical protein
LLSLKEPTSLKSWESIPWLWAIKRKDGFLDTKTTLFGLSSLSLLTLAVTYFTVLSILWSSDYPSTGCQRHKDAPFYKRQTLFKLD